MKTIFLTFAILIFSLPSHSQEVECGLDGNGNINAYSFEICKEDTSFNMVYSLLGFLYDEYVFPLGYTKHINQEKTAEVQAESTQYYQRFGIIFKDIFRAMNYITMVVLFFLLAYFSVAAIFNSAKGDFLGETWDKQASLKRVMIGGILLTPINGISVIQILILNLSLISISGANFVVSGFLGFMENNIPEIAEEGEFDKVIDSEAETSIYFDYALMDLKKLTKIAICRNRTSEYLLEKKITTNDNMEDFIKCNSPSHDSIPIESEDSGFIRYQYINKYKDQGNYFTGGINFGNTVGKTCNRDFTEEYSCGGLNFPNLSINLKDYEKNNYEVDRIILSIANNIEYSTSMNEQIFKEWKGFWKYLSEDSDYFKRKSIATKTSKRKIASYYFHQMIQTHLTVGLAFGNVEAVSNNGTVDVSLKNTNNLPIKEKIQFANEIAKKIESLNCVGDFTKLIKTKNAAKKLKDKTDSTQVISECLYHNANGDIDVLGLINGELPYINQETKEEDVAKIKQYIKDTIDDSEIEIRKVVNKLYMIKKSVMDSFQASIEHYERLEDTSSSHFKNNILVQARQLGWGSFGSLMRRIIQEKDGESKLKKSLLEGVHYEENMTSSMVSLDIPQENRKYPNLKNDLDKMFNSFYNNRKLNKIEDLSINKYLDSYIEQSQSLETGTGVSSDDFFSKIMTSPVRIIETFKTNLGMGKFSDKGNEVLVECIKGNGQCGIPLIHPMETITKLGKDLIALSAGIFAFSITESMVMSKINEKRIENIDKETKEKEKSGGISGKKKRSSPLNKMGSIGKLLNGNIFSYIVDILMAFFWMLMIIGFVAAYVLPLVPFFIFTIALIGWVIILFQILIISNIWIVLFFQPRSQGENREGIQAAYNATMQLLLRPALITASLILGWWLFSILIMVVNLSIGPLFATITSEEHLMGLINVTFGLSFYVIIIYIILRIAFKLIEELPKKVFAVLGVTAESEDQEQFRNLAEALIGYQVVQNVTKGSVQKSREKEKEIYKELKERRKKLKEEGDNS